MKNSLSFKIHSASGWTMFIFGALALVLGLIGLLRPEWTLALLGFQVLERAARASGDYTVTFHRLLDGLFQYGGILPAGGCQ